MVGGHASQGGACMAGGTCVEGGHAWQGEGEHAWQILRDTVNEWAGMHSSFKKKFRKMILMKCSVTQRTHTEDIIARDLHVILTQCFPQR